MYNALTYYGAVNVLLRSFRYSGAVNIAYNFNANASDGCLYSRKYFSKNHLVKAHLYFLVMQDKNTFR